MVDPELIKRRLHNFWGYGSLQAPVWFVGMEEGLGATNESELESRFVASDGKQMIDIREEMRDVPLHMRFYTTSRPPLQRTLQYPIALYLHIKHGKEPAREEIRHHQAYEFGDVEKRISSSLDLMPLPSRDTKKESWRYSQSGIDTLSSRKRYLDAHGQRRVDELRALISRHTPKLVIFHSIRYLKFWIKVMGSEAPKITRQMYFGKIQNTSFCIIPQGSAYGMSKSRVSEFADKIAPDISL